MAGTTKGGTFMHEKFRVGLSVYNLWSCPYLNSPADFVKKIGQVELPISPN